MGETKTASPLAARLGGGTGMFAQRSLDDAVAEESGTAESVEDAAASIEANARRGSRGAGARLATDRQKNLLREMIAERQGAPGLDAIKDRLNKAREGGYLTEVIFKEAFDALKGIARTDQEQVEGDEESEAVGIFEAPDGVHPGRYTLEDGVEGHRTFRVKLQDKDADFAPGQTLLEFLCGPDNTSDYQTFAFIKKGKLHVWGRFKGETALVADAEKFMADPEAALAVKFCLRCGADLTVPSSVKLGMGPSCAKKGWGI